MNKTEFARGLAQRLDMSAAEAGRVTDEFINQLRDALVSGDKVSFLGFGTFSVTERAGRLGVNPRNPGERVEIPARKAVRFAPGAPLKAALNPPKPKPKAKAAAKKSTKKK